MGLGFTGLGFTQGNPERYGEVVCGFGTLGFEFWSLAGFYGHPKVSFHGGLMFHASGHLLCSSLGTRALGFRLQCLLL